MSSRTPDGPHAQPQGQAPCGLRVVERPRAVRRRQWLWLLAAGLVSLSAVVYLLLPVSPGDPRGTDAGIATRTSAPEAPAVDARPAPVKPTPVASPLTVQPTETPPTVAERADFTLPSLDPNDLAAHIRPGDPEPTMAEVIRGLHEAGIREGLGAFNPPGTVPLMPGLAVPEDFALPPGYVRHYQVTDEGEMLPAVLMFSPDHQWFDADGRPIAMPDDRLVPPEMAPPGLPIEPIPLPEPPQD
jgi:hypothetical protein